MAEVALKVGVIGNTGRLGRAVVDCIEQHPYLQNGLGFSRSQVPFIAIEEVFDSNDYIIDCSKPKGLSSVLKAAIVQPKPLVICTTGWQYQEMNNMLEVLSKSVPIVIAPNTSIGAFLQRYLVGQMAKLLGNEYDIDVSEKHHRNKVDIPSGTAKALLAEVVKSKQQEYGISYTSAPLAQGPRPDNFIGMTSERSGDIAGDHKVSFTSRDEMICIKHVVFDRAIFAKGALKIVEWLQKHEIRPGVYDTQDVYL